MIVLGSSEIVYGYAAPLVYKEHGIASFPLAFHINPVPLWKYELTEILKTQSPKMLMIEVNGALYDENYLKSKSSFYNFCESISFSENKVNLISELAPEGKLECYFPFLSYHDSLLSGRDFAKSWIKIQRMKFAPLRGAATYLNNKEIPFDKIKSINDETTPLDPMGEKYLLELMEILKESKIDNIVFVRYPHLETSKRSIKTSGRYNEVKRIVNEHGFEFIDLDAKIDEIGIDTHNDFWDVGHLNAYGQRKITQYLGELFVSDYGIETSQISEKASARWQQSVNYIDAFYAYYEEYMAEHAGEEYADNNLILRDSYEGLTALEEYLQKE